MREQLRVDEKVPQRYERLVVETVKRLPPGWAGDIVITVRVASELNPRGFANATRADPERPWAKAVMTLFPSKMDELSDAACLWMIAHECGHLTQDLPAHATIGGRDCLYVQGKWRRSKADPKRLNELYEEAADTRARQWGFGEEEKAFRKEMSIDQE